MAVLPRSLGRRRLIAAAGVAGVVTVALVAPALAAASTLTATGLTASVSGTTVNVRTTISASPAAKANLAGVCARSANGSHRDFPLTADVALSTSGTTLTASATLPAGTYSYWSCAKVAGVWTDIGTRQSVTVGATVPPTTSNTAPSPTATTTSPTTASPTTASPTTASPTTGTPTPTTTAPTTSTTAPTTTITTSTTATTAPTTPAGSGEAMPVGNLPGFTQIFTDDFTTDLAAGSFPGAYKPKWASYTGYADTYGTGMFNQKIISMHDGLMDLNLHTENGRAQVAAPAPQLKTGSWAGQTYGKYTARFRADALPGYKASWLLWPDSNNWNEGEIDFPEGGLDKNMFGFNHCLGNPSKNCDWVDTKTTYTNWHTASIEWTPKGVSYLLDGTLLKTSTTAIPTKPMHWVLQTETGSANPDLSKSGHVLIDWVSIYSYTG